jgi:serine/threonine-protein kinase
MSNDGTADTERPESHGLKVVTLSPGTGSMVDSEELMREPGTLTPAPPLAKRQDPYLGATIDNRYKLDRILGEGGMGVVYRATHTIIGKKVAVKVLRADMARDEEATERFLNEARSASAIGNPHIIDISDFGRFPDGSTYFVMEYLDGKPLSEEVKGGKLVAVPRLLHIARQLAEGLAAAHDSGIVHRDLKPDNIFLVTRGTTKDFIKILDFGIAKVTSEGSKLTRAGAVFGTPHYMAPEQAAGAPVDHRGDIYAFGVILYELASGKVPFDADNFMGILTQHMYKAPVPIRALLPEPQDIPPGLEAIVLKCLSKRPEQRYATMHEVHADIEKLANGLTPSAVPELMSRSQGFNVPADYFRKSSVEVQAQAAPRPPRWPLYAGAAGVLASVGLVFLIFAAGRESTASQAGGVATVASAPAATTPAALPSTPATAPGAQAARKVVIAVEPLEAMIFQGDQRLGQSPVIVEVPAGRSIELTLQATGFRPRVINVDDSLERRSIKLEKERASGAGVSAGGQARPPVAPATPATTGKPPKKNRLGGGEIVDPWSGG